MNIAKNDWFSCNKYKHRGVGKELPHMMWGWEQADLQWGSQAGTAATSPPDTLSRKLISFFQITAWEVQLLISLLYAKFTAWKLAMSTPWDAPNPDSVIKLAPGLSSMATCTLSLVRKKELAFWWVKVTHCKIQPDAECRKFQSESLMANFTLACIRLFPHRNTKSEQSRLVINILLVPSPLICKLELQKLLLAHSQKGNPWLELKK